MSTAQLDTKYNWNTLEKKWYSYWLSKNYFHANENSSKETFTIVIPPPNVTGKLTMGHVLNNTIQDILIRKARMEGKNTCWIPGTDHASIATEAKVVSMLKEKGIDKNDLTREEFLNHAWEWKDKYGGIIIKQLKTLGCSCDWDRERFTMDEEYSKAVMHAFVELYRKELIYKGKRLVNWCPVSKSAISDEEVIHQEKNGKLWYLKYPLVGHEENLVVATTRPETMLGDTAVAVNPKDERFKDYIGKKIKLPLTEREIPIISDEFVNIEFGTGCVKVTPAHDPNDFEMGQRHNLKFINIMNDDATLNENVPKKFQKLSREEARKLVVAEMESLNLLDKIEDYTNNIGFSERGGVPIEYYLSDQWYLKMDDLAKPAMDVIKSKKINFHPEHWTKTYSHWMENIKDWCISRQLVWGHQIPVWYNKKNPESIHVSIDGPDDPENWSFICWECETPFSPGLSLAVDHIMENGGRIVIDPDARPRNPVPPKPASQDFATINQLVQDELKQTGADADTMTQAAEQSALTSGLMSIDDWIDQTLAAKGYIQAQEDREDFILRTGAGATKFNKWMKKAGLYFNKQTGRWSRWQDR